MIFEDLVEACPSEQTTGTASAVIDWLEPARQRLRPAISSDRTAIAKLSWPMPFCSGAPSVGEPGTVAG